MLRTDSIPQFQIMLVAWTPAIAIILATRKECAKHAMLHVKHRHVLMNRNLEPLRRSGLKQRYELLEIQIVTRGHALQSEFVFEVIRGDTVCDVQRKISDLPVIRKEFQMIVIADEITIGIAGADLFQRPFLAHFENTWRSDENGRGLKVKGRRQRCIRL